MQPLTILVVDDYKPLLDSARRTLRDYHVLVAENASDAKDLANARHPDVAIVDVFLGEESGIELIAELKKAQPGLVVVAYSANFSTDLEVEAARAGATRAEPKHRPIAQVVRGVEALAHPEDQDDRFDDWLHALAGHTDLGALLDEALALAVACTRADTGYIELFDRPEAPRFWRSHNASDDTVSTVRAAIERSNPRVQYADRTAIHQIITALCIPSGRGIAEGLLYLRTSAGAGFEPIDRVRACNVAEQVATIVHRLKA